MAATPSPVNPACGRNAPAPCDWDDRQRQGAGGASCRRAPREPEATQGPVSRRCRQGNAPSVRL